VTPNELIEKYRFADLYYRGNALADLKTIDWQSLQDAYGASSSTPILLHATLSDDASDREFAFVLLHETIIHQGTTWEVTPFVIPFLFRLIEFIETKDEFATLFLLSTLVWGTGSVTVRTPDLDRWLPLMYPYLYSEESYIRGALAQLLVMYTQYEDQVLPLIEDALSKESDEFTRGDFEKALDYVRYFDPARGHKPFGDSPF
jgi:hypothetical protein